MQRKLIVKCKNLCQNKNRKNLIIDEVRNALKILDKINILGAFFEIFNKNIMETIEKFT